MQTLNEIKNEVALDYGYDSYLDVFEFTYALCDEVAKRYARQCCEDLRERIATADVDLVGYNVDVFSDPQIEIIRNVEIITP